MNWYWIQNYGNVTVYSKQTSLETAIEKSRKFGGYSDQLDEIAECFSRHNNQVVNVYNSEGTFLESFENTQAARNFVKKNPETIAYTEDFVPTRKDPFGVDL